MLASIYLPRASNGVAPNTDDDAHPRGRVGLHCRGALAGRRAVRRDEGTVLQKKAVATGKKIRADQPSQYRQLDSPDKEQVQKCARGLLVLVEFPQTHQSP